MKYADPELRDRLASEYALGTMSGPERRRFERLLADDRDLRNLVEDWELRLNLLAETAPAVEPPESVWNGIVREIAPAPAPAPAPVDESWLDRLWDSLGFWRAAAALAGATAAALVFYVALRPSMGPEQRSEEHTSELQSRGHLVCRLLLEKKKKQKITKILIKKKKTKYCT